MTNATCTGNFLNTLFQPCRHCQRANPTRPRGLCYPCFKDRSIRALYASRSKYANRGPGNRYWFAVPEPIPTTSPVGSAERIAVYAERVERGEAVFHPKDSKDHQPARTDAAYGEALPKRSRMPIRQYRIHLRSREDHAIQRESA